MNSAAHALLRLALLAGGIVSSAAALAQANGTQTPTADAAVAAASADAAAASSGFSYRLRGNLAGLGSGSTVAMPVRLSGGFGLLPPGQEFVLSTTPSTTRLPVWLQSALPPAPLGSSPRVGLDGTRATYRYTVLEADGWAWKVGLTASLFDSQAAVQPALGLGADRWRLGATPMMHFSGSGRFGDRWQLSLDADTGRGHALDFDVRVDYGLGRDLSLYGGYRLVESLGEEELTGPTSTTSNTANVGIRMRF